MTAAKRPSTTRKVTPKSEANRKAILDEAIGIKVDGVEHSIRPADMNGLVERQIRSTIGMGALELFESLERSPGMDLIGMWIWVCEYVNGNENADLDAALGSVSWASDIDIAENPKGPNLPEA